MNKYHQRTAALPAAILLMVLTAPVHSEPEIVGWLEGAYLQPWGVRVRAKLDTGARTSAMHAENIETFEKDGQLWVRFRFPYGRREGYPQGFTIERPLARQTKVKNGSGLHPRYVIELDVCISGKTQTIEVSLADRSIYNYPMLLGRQSLAGRFIIDPDQIFLGSRTCPRKLAPKSKPAGK
jgi:hypothetical protein